MMPRRAVLAVALAGLAAVADAQATLTAEQRKTLDEIAGFVEKELKEPEAAQRIRQDVAAGRIVFGPIDGGAWAETDPGRYPITLTDSLPELVGGRSRPDKEIDRYRYMAEIAATLEHEYVHAGQSWLAWHLRYSGTTRTNTYERDGWRAGFQALDRYLAKALRALEAGARAPLAERMQLAEDVYQLADAWIVYAGSYRTEQFPEMTLLGRDGMLTLEEREEQVRRIRDRAFRARRLAQDQLGFDGIYEFAMHFEGKDDYCRAHAAGCVAPLGRIEVRFDRVFHQGRPVGSIDPAGGAVRFSVGAATFRGTFPKGWDARERRWVTKRLQGSWSCGTAVTPSTFLAYRVLPRAPERRNAPCEGTTVAKRPSPAPPRPSPVTKAPAGAGRWKLAFVVHGKLERPELGRADTATHFLEVDDADGRLACRYQSYRRRGRDPADLLDAAEAVLSWSAPRDAAPGDRWGGFEAKVARADTAHTTTRDELFEELRRMRQGKGPAPRDTRREPLPLRLRIDVSADAALDCRARITGGAAIGAEVGVDTTPGARRRPEYVFPPNPDGDGFLLVDLDADFFVSNIEVSSHHHYCYEWVPAGGKPRP